MNLLIDIKNYINLSRGLFSPLNRVVSDVNSYENIKLGCRNTSIFYELCENQTGFFHSSDSRTEGTKMCKSSMWVVNIYV